jgi:regulatory protein
VAERPRSRASRTDPIQPSTRSTDPLSGAYVLGLKMLARRELSESQVRDRLGRRGYPEDAIDDAVARLKSERAIDDHRVAEATARTEVALKRRGRRRVSRHLENLGIDRAIAHRALDAVFSTVDERSLLEVTLAKRLRGGRPIADEAERRRLYRFLIAQGFEVDEVIRALEARSVK